MIFYNDTIGGKTEIDQNLKRHLEVSPPGRPTDCIEGCRFEDRARSLAESTASVPRVQFVRRGAGPHHVQLAAPDAREIEIRLGDWLPIYNIDDEDLHLVRAGTHSEQF